MSKVRVTITLKNHHHIAFVVDDDCTDLGNIISELIRDLGKNWDDVESVGYKVIK